MRDLRGSSLAAVLVVGVGTFVACSPATFGDTRPASPAPRTCDGSCPKLQAAAGYEIQERCSTTAGQGANGGAVCVYSNCKQIRTCSQSSRCPADATEMTTCLCKTDNAPMGGDTSGAYTACAQPAPPTPAPAASADLRNIKTCTMLNAPAPPPKKKWPTLDPHGKLVYPATSSSGNGSSSSGLAIDTDQMWEQGQTVRVRLSETGSTEAIRVGVERWALHWVSYARIDFKFVGPSEEADIRVGFEDNGRSNSQVGRRALSVKASENTMNFGWLNRPTTTPEELRRVVLHEFGHALGLIHEHQSPAATIQWDEEKVYAYYSGPPNNWDKATTKSNIMDNESSPSINYPGGYDPFSIMHYPVPKEFTLNHQEVGMNTELSIEDKKWIGYFYPKGDVIGSFSTGDNCDNIEFELRNDLMPQDKFMLVLKFGQNVTWWKGVQIPVTGGNYEIAEADGPNPLKIVTIDAAMLDSGRRIKFGKAGFGGVHNWLPFSWDAMPALRGGHKLTIRWTKDRC